MFTLYWVAADFQSDFNMGEFTTFSAAEAAIPAALQELLENCGEEYQKEEIRNGTFGISESE